MSDLERLATTLRHVALANMKPKDVIAAVRQHHPEATKKQIVRAAFYALTQDAAHDGPQARQLHAFALTERASEEEEPTLERVRKKAKRKKAAGGTDAIRSAPLG